MPDLLETAFAWLADQLKAHTSCPVVYRRGSEQVPVLATVGQTRLKLDDGLGSVRMEPTDRDFFIQAIDLVLAGEQVLPQQGDRIHETVGTRTFIYEVMGSAGEPPWLWSDPFRKLLRIHTKQVGTE